MAKSCLSAQWQMLEVSSHPIASCSYSLPNGRYVGMSCRGMTICLPNGRYWECSIGGITLHLPNGGFQSATYWWSMMSSMVGPVERVPRPRPLMVTLPTEVVTMST